MEEIAYKLGYSDVPNFYRAFRAWTSRTPLLYRKNKTLN
jgi:AraC-like DNA-binding protein